MADNEIRNPSKAYFKWKMPVIAKSKDDWNFWNTEEKYNRTMFIGYNDTTTPHVASLFLIVDGKAIQAVGDDVLARISKMETDVAEALADIQVLIDRVNAQQLEISNLQQECERILAQAADTVLDAHTWAEGTDDEVADLGGEHSAKGWAQKANDIVAAGLPSDSTFDHITVTSNSKFGQDPDRGNQPGLEIEGTGEIQAYRTVNMMNGATVSYDETVEMPWSDSSNKVPNTAWVQQAVQHGSIDPNTDLTVKSITTTAGFNLLYKDSAKSHAQLQAKKTSNGADLRLYMLDSDHGGTYVYNYLMRAGTNNEAYFGNPGKVTWAAANDLNLRAAYDVVVSAGTGRFVTINPKLRIGGTVFVVDASVNPATASFGVTPTVPDITDAADSSDKVPNTKWVRDCMTTLTADLQPKLTAGDGIEISADNVISATGGGSGGGAVTSVNGKTGEVVLSASDVGAASSSDLASYVTTDAMNTELTNFATNASVDTKLADYQRKLIAGDGIAISESNVISVTGGTGGGAVSSVNGKTGEVVLNATDVGAITGAEADTKITTALEPYAKTADITTTLEPYAKSADVTAEITAAVAPLATTEALTTGLAGKQDKLTAGSGIAISADNVISATVSSPVDSVNGKTGTVVLSGEDIKLHPTAGEYTYPAVSDVIDSISGYLPDGVASDNKLVDNSGLSTHLAQYQPKLTAGEGITISPENVISATGGGGGGGAVTSVNGNTGAVVLTADNVMLNASSTTSINTALAGKQDSLTEASDLTVGSLTAGSADSGLYAGRYSIRFTSTGTDKLFVDATGPYVSNLTGGDLGPATGAFNWYINTTTDYNKFNVFNRYYETNAETQEVNTYDTSVLSIGGSPDNHSTWIDFTATYMSFKGNTNFGETGMNHAMNFNGPSSFNNEANFHGSTHVFGNVTFWKSDAEGSTTPWASFDKSTGKFDIDYLTSTDGGNGENRVTIMADSREANYGATFNLPVTVSDASFKRTSTLAADDNSTEVPTTAWVKSAIAASGGSVPDDITCKTLSVTDTGTVHILNVGDGKAGQKFNCNTDASFGYNVNIGWTSGRLKCMRDEYNWLFDFNRNASPGSMLKFNDTVTILSAMPAATDSSNKVPTTAWVQGAITAAVQSKADAVNTVTTDTVQTITGVKVFTREQRKKATNIDITTQPEKYLTNNAIRFVDSNDKIMGYLENSQQADGRIKTGIHARNKDDYQQSIGVWVPQSGTTGAYATAPSTPDNPAGNVIATVDWVRKVAGGPSKNDSVTTAFSGSITSRTYTIYKNGNLWSIHLTVTLNTVTLNNETTELWAFMTDIKDDADLTKLLAGQVLFMNAYISGCTMAAQPGYYAIGVTALRMENGDLKAKVRSFDSTITDIPAGLELSFDLTTWVSN